MKIIEEDIGPVRLVSTKTERDITVTAIYIPNFDPEVQAALGATLSRDPGTAESRLEKLFSDPETKKRIMEVFFKNYGHNSIGDMGFFMFSIEGLSMRGAVDVVEDRLFNGQEASTRYLDFEKMGFLPIDTETDINSAECFTLYKEVKNSVMEELLKSGVSEKAAEPQAFDVAAAFLPISTRTNVFWVGNIRSAIKLNRRLNSMNEECREISRASTKILDVVCPNSQRDFEDNMMLDRVEDEMHLARFLAKQAKMFSGGVSFNSFDMASFSRYVKEKNFSFTDSLGGFGIINVAFEIDYRSLRDVHRHRAFLKNMVLYYSGENLEVEQFYLDAISNKELRALVEEKLGNIFSNYNKPDIVVDNSSYGLPMATKLPYFMSGDLPAWLYFLNLRSGEKVHPTVIAMAQRIGSVFEDSLGIEKVYQRGGADYLKRSADENKI